MIRCNFTRELTFFRPKRQCHWKFLLRRVDLYINYFRFQKGVDNFSWGEVGGPLVIFNASTWTTLVTSPSKNFMAANMMHNLTSDSLHWGLMGLVNDIPSGFTIETILHVGTGINSAMEGWGGFLTKYYGKDKSMMESDLVNNYIGYWTDNGDYYYPDPDDRNDFEKTLIDAMQYHMNDNNIPYRYLQLDAYWYYRTATGGCLNWTVRANIFPNGIQKLHSSLGIPIVAHNMYFEPKTNYAKQNGGDYNFIVEASIAIPDDITFWEDLFSNSSQWGLISYEQDFMETTYMGLQ